MGNRLNPDQRQRDLTALGQQDYDVVVIGGGIVGAGVALDAAARGLKTAVIEAQDWASGTSSRSSRLIRGGLRYLYQFDAGLVRDAIRERGLLLHTIAPHLVRPVRFIWPLHARLVERVPAAAVIGIYDALNATVGQRALPPHRHRTRAGVLARFPGLAPAEIVGGIEFNEAQVDDARLVLALIRTAVEYGAQAISRAQVVRITRAADAPVTGLIVRDLETGDELQVRTRGVISATGVWTERTQELAQTNSRLRVFASKGIHIFVPRQCIDAKTGVFFRDGEQVFYIMGWHDYWLIGTTDTAWHQQLTHPVPTSTDIEQLLSRVNRYLKRRLTRDDVCGSFAGLRPLIEPARLDEEHTMQLSRGHAIAQVAPGMVAVAGGKLTTYRSMAAAAVDQLIGRSAASKNPSVTRRTPLVGAQGWAAMSNQSDRIGGIYGWEPATMARLLERYGSELPELLELVDDDPTMAAPLQAAPRYLRAEVARACVAEGAQHLEDIMIQRVRLNSESRDRGAAAVDEVAAIAAPLLDWDQRRCAREKQNYLARVAAERAAEDEATDAAAVTVRRSAPDIVASTLN